MNLVEIGDLFTFKKGKKPIDLLDICPVDGARFLQIDHLRGKGEDLFTKDKNGTKVEQDDICIVWDGANAGLVGYGLEGFIGSTITRLRLSTEENVYTPFIAKFLQSQFSFLNQTAQGAAIPHVDGKKLKRLKVALPALEEQKRIAEILGKADALCRKREQVIAFTNELLSSVFLDMFGDPITNPKGFKNCVLQDLYISEKDGTKCGPFGSALKKNEYLKSGIPVWNMDNISKSGEFISPVNLWISEAKFKELSSYRVINGDIIISRAGTVGKMCVVNSEYDKSIISTNLIRLRLSEKISPIYFVSLMNFCKGRVGRLKTGPDGAFTHMNTGILDKLKFPLPPKELQKEYEDIYHQIKKRMNDHNFFLEKSNLFFSSLSQRAFSGELTLRKKAA